MHLAVNKDCFFKANNAMLTEVRLLSKKAEEQRASRLWLHSQFVLKLHSLYYYSVPSARLRLSHDSKKQAGKGEGHQ